MGRFKDQIRMRRKFQEMGAQIVKQQKETQEKYKELKEAKEKGSKEGSLPKAKKHTFRVVPHGADKFRIEVMWRGNISWEPFFHGTLWIKQFNSKAEAHAEIDDIVNKRSEFFKNILKHRDNNTPEEFS